MGDIYFRHHRKDPQCLFPPYPNPPSDQFPDAKVNFGGKKDMGRIDLGKMGKLLGIRIVGEIDVHTGRNGLGKFILKMGGVNGCNPL